MLFDDLWGKPLAAFVEKYSRMNTGMRGKRYARQGRVIELQAGGENEIQGRVRGSGYQPYVVILRIAGGKLESDCSCPVGYFCKHAYAVALVLLAEAYWRLGSAYGELEFEHFPVEWRPRKRAIAPDSMKKLAAIFDPAAQNLDPALPAKTRRWQAENNGFPPIEMIRGLHGDEGSTINEETRSIFAEIESSLMNILDQVESKYGTKKAQKASTPKGIPTPDVNSEEKRPWWEAFIEGKTRQDRRAAVQRGIRRYAPRYSGKWETESCVNAFLDYTNPVAALRDCSQIVNRHFYHYAHEKFQPEPEIQDYLASEPVRILDEQHRTRIAEGVFFEWLKSTPPGQEEQTRNAAVEVRWLLLPEPSGLSKLCFQLLLTTQKLQRSPRHPQAITQLSNDLNRRSRIMDPIHGRFVEWVSRQSYLYYSSAENPDDPTILPVRGALNWVSLWLEQGLVFWENGERVVFNPLPARLKLEPRPEAPPQWMIELPEPGNPEPSRLPLRAAEVFVEPSDADSSGANSPVFIRLGNAIQRLETGSIPPQVLASLRQLSDLPIARIRDMGMTQTLVRKLGPDPVRPGNPAAPGLIEELPVKPVVELRLERASSLSATFVADAGDGRVFHQRGGGEWTLRESHPASDPVAINNESADAASPDALVSLREETREGGDQTLAGTETAPSETGAPASAPNPYALARVPRIADVGPVQSWLDDLVPSQAGHFTNDLGAASRVWRADGPAAIMNILRAWPRRPANATYLGNRAFKNLVTRRAAPTLKFEIKSTGLNWFEIDVGWEDELESITDELMAALMKPGDEELVILSGGRVYRREDLEGLRKKMDVIAGLGLAPGQGKQRLHAAHLAGKAGESLIEISQSEGDLAVLADHVRGLARSFRGIPEVKSGKKIDAALRSYQSLGRDFLVWAAQTFGGALLADEMGLGKTLQVLAALTTLKAQSDEKKPSLVICPTSVVHNWVREAAHFAPTLKVAVIERGVARKELYDRLDKFDLVVTNYALARLDAAKIRDREWRVVCVDEAQAIKNAHAEIARIVKTFPADYRIALTGTPVENRLADLASIMDFVLPGYLRGHGNLEKMTTPDENPALFRALRARMRPVLLRRLKSEVAPELPDRIEERIDCEMTVKQKKAYLAEIKKTRELLGQGKGSGISPQDRIRILAQLTRMRQLCLEPHLVGIPDAGSGKLDILMEMIPRILESGHKVLLFSQFVRMLEILEKRLKHEKIPYYLLTGQTQKRQELVEAFEKDPAPSVFMISLKAGGTGLNLVSASHVILFDPWWNPAVEAQAIDRTHRIGQDKTVLAFRLVTRGTIEERILELQEKKKGIIKGILEEDTFNRTLTKEDFEYLLAQDTEMVEV